jgi:hypothetical protein
MGGELGQYGVMKFVELPSGLIINLDQVAYVHRTQGNLTVYFAAVGRTQEGSEEALRLLLEGRDGEAFINVLHNVYGVKREE